MRNITIAPSVRLLKNTLTLAGNTGFQKNNLDKSRASTTKRFIGSINANYLPDELWNFGLNYSNFSTFTNIRPLQDPFFQNSLDTLNFYQLSQTLNGTISKILGGQENPQSVIFTTSYQVASDQASFEGSNQQSKFITFNGSYSFSFPTSGTTLAIAGNIYKNKIVGMKTTFWGPTFVCSKTFMEKMLKSTFSTSYNETSGGELKISPILNNRINVTYTHKGKTDSKSKHNLSLGVNVVNRLISTEQQPEFTEVTGTGSYSYSF